ncbi:MAG: LysR family transcriptional regulator [Alphaproteobacteria bacterium]|nr:MAG: LysR family transcriptional regulator [Alphaproteobacteria bacterium]
MDLRQLRYFISIVEQGSFSKAAQELNVAQPALSLHVRNMEESLGTKLLFRGPHGVTTTEAGQILLRNARMIIEQINHAQEEILEHEAEPAGEVHLGLPGTISQILSVPLLLAARDRYPKIKLRIAEAMSGFVLEWMRDMRVDLALLYIPVSDRQLVSHPVLTENLWLLGPPKPMPGVASPSTRTVSFDAIARLPLVLPSHSHGLRSLLEDAAARNEFTLGPILEADSYGNIKGLVEAGAGYSILPFNAIAREVSAGRLLTWKIKEPGITRSVYVVKPVDRPMGNAARAIYSLVNETLNMLVDTGKWHGVKKAPKEKSN